MPHTCTLNILSPIPTTHALLLSPLSFQFWSGALQVSTKLPPHFYSFPSFLISPFSQQEHSLAVLPPLFLAFSLQLYDSPAYCEGLRKVLPLDDANGGFESLTVWHMTDSKLHSRGKGVTPVREVIAYLEDDKARKIAGRKERVDG